MEQTPHAATMWESVRNGCTPAFESPIPVYQDPGLDWLKITSRISLYLFDYQALDTLTFHRGALPHDFLFLGKHLVVDVSSARTWMSLFNNVRSFFLLSKEGRVPLEGPFVKDISLRSVIVESLRALLWPRVAYSGMNPSLRFFFINHNTMVPIVLVIFLVLTGDSSSCFNSRKSSSKKMNESPSTEGLSVAGMSNLSMTRDSVFRCTSMCTRAAEYLFHKG